LDPFQPGESAENQSQDMTVKEATMVIILIYWQIKEEKAEEFEKYWKMLMNVETKKGFYREILTKPVTMSDPKFNTFSITDRNYRTYINIGFWNSIGDFERAVRETMPISSQVTDPASGRIKQTIELEPFEFKVRERIVLTPVSERGGSLPDVPDLEPAVAELHLRKMSV
jgi:heme-degrading monooxygenase HmoA